MDQDLGKMPGPHSLPPGHCNRVEVVHPAFRPEHPNGPAVDSNYAGNTPGLDQSQTSSVCSTFSTPAAVSGPAINKCKEQQDDEEKHDFKTVAGHVILSTWHLQTDLSIQYAIRYC